MRPRYDAPLRLVVLACALLTTSACYDANRLIDQRLETANQKRLEEVDLGAFRITLPPATGALTHGVVEFHAFGQVAKKHRQRVEQSLEERGPELRHQMLLAVRRLSIEQIQDSNLSVLRNEVRQVVNDPWETQLVEHIGFYQFNFLPL